MKRINDSIILHSNFRKQRTGSFSQLRDVTHTNIRSLWEIDFTITSNRGQSPYAIGYHNLLGGCDTQTHLDFDPDAFERRSSSH